MIFISTQIKTNFKHLKAGENLKYIWRQNNLEEKNIYSDIKSVRLILFYSISIFL